MIRSKVLVHCVAAAVAIGVAVGRPGAAAAVEESESGKILSVIAVNATNAAVAVNGAQASANCFYTLMGFDPTTTLGRLFYITLLEAKRQQTPVDITYDRNGQSCVVKQVTVR